MLTRRNGEDKIKVRANREGKFVESIIYSLPVSSAYRERGHNIPVKSGTLQNGYSSPKAVKPYILGHRDYVDHAVCIEQ